MCALRFIYFLSHLLPRFNLLNPVFVDSVNNTGINNSGTESVPGSLKISSLVPISISLEIQRYTQFSFERLFTVNTFHSATYSVVLYNMPEMAAPRVCTRQMGGDFIFILCSGGLRKTAPIFTLFFTLGLDATSYTHMHVPYPPDPPERL